MDFDPESEKWECCCCHLMTGLKIWTSIEVAASILFTVIVFFEFNDALKAENSDLIFDLGLLIICLMMSVGSSLLLIGLQKYQQKLMYPTIIARISLVIFVSAFGVSRFVLDRTELSAEENWKRRKRPFDQERAESSTASRLAFLVFFMILLSAAVFYTIYLVVRGINYIRAFCRLQQRRQSLIAASQIDPELMAVYRRQSQFSIPT